MIWHLKTLCTRCDSVLLNHTFPLLDEQKVAMTDAPRASKRVANANLYQMLPQRKCVIFPRNDLSFALFDAQKTSICVILLTSNRHTRNARRQTMGAMTQGLGNAALTQGE